MIFRWWMPPAIGIGICAIANGALILTTFHVRPQKSEDRPYAASSHEDERAAERGAFSTRGWTLAHTIDASGCVLTLVSRGGSQPVAGVVQLYRPDDQSADRQLVWTDLTAPLRCPLPRPGAWSLRVELRDTTGAVLSCDLRLSRP